MEEKIKNIPTLMIREDSSIGIKSFSETADGFQLETPLSEFNHRTLLKYEEGRATFVDALHNVARGGGAVLLDALKNAFQVFGGAG